MKFILFMSQLTHCQFMLDKSNLVGVSFVLSFSFLEFPLRQSEFIRVAE